MSDPTIHATAADAPVAFTAADAVKLFDGVTVTVPKLDKDGDPIRDAETKRFVTVALPLAAEHVISVRDLGGSVSITTVDGQKYQAGKAGDKPAKKSGNK